MAHHSESDSRADFGADTTPDRPGDNRPSDAAVLEFLREHHGEDARDLELLPGGFWSAAYAYRVGDDELVLRISDTPHGFRADRLATGYKSTGLPVPEVLTIGEGFGRWFAISRRHHGRFLEDAGVEEADALRPTLVALLSELRTVPDTGAPTPPWRNWLLNGIGDRPGNFTSGWRQRLTAHSDAERIFRGVDNRIRALLDACPDRRELVHSDLLHQNVLITPSADAVTAVFSWKCSTWGDALYDLAWCTFWGRWHEGIGALNLWDHILPTLPPSASVDAGTRHHVYELQIGANHLAWHTTLGEEGNLRWTLDQLEEILERGPLR